MKKNRLLLIGFIISGLFSGCSDDDNKILPSSGENVNFTLSTAQSRTEYDSSNEYQINWTEGDKVRIFCEEAEDVKSADYSVLVSSENKNEGNLQSIVNGLKWGNEGIHNFYAIYPADDSKIIGKSGDVVTLSLNKDQICTFIEDENGNYIGNPDMGNAYMIADLSTKPIDNVALNFKPLMTTLQITVRGRSDVNSGTIALTGLNIINNNVKDKAAYQGNFKYDLVRKALVEDSSTPFTQTIFVGIKHVVKDETGSEKINQYIDLAGGKSATFTVFIPPMLIDQNNQLTIRPSVAGDAELEVVIGGNEDANGQVITYPSSSKGKLTLPEWPTAQTGNNWITPLDGNIYVQQLSIPGTHDSGAYSTTVADAGRTQALTISEQWNIGIRAFDVRTAYRTMVREFWIYHGLTLTDISLEDLLLEITLKLQENPKEFAIVQLRHEADAPFINTGKWNDIYDILVNKLVNINMVVKWRPDLVVDDCRGKIIILTRDDYSNRSYAGLISNWPDNTYGIAQIANGGIETDYLVQDYYHYNGDEGAEKKAMFEKLLNITKEFNISTSENFLNKTWALNHVSGYDGLVGGTNAYMRNAQNVVPYIYNLVENTAGPTGIVFMDYVGQRESPSWAGISTFTMYGDLLPQSIINNNYRYYMLRKMN